MTICGDPKKAFIGRSREKTLYWVHYPYEFSYLSRKTFHQKKRISPPSPHRPPSTSTCTVQVSSCFFFIARSSLSFFLIVIHSFRDADVTIRGASPSHADFLVSLVVREGKPRPTFASFHLFASRSSCVPLYTCANRDLKPFRKKTSTTAAPPKKKS